MRSKQKIHLNPNFGQYWGPEQTSPVLPEINNFDLNFPKFFKKKAFFHYVSH